MLYGMNNKFYLTILTASAIVMGFSVSVTLATVGGPTLVYDLKFDSKTNSVYYTVGEGGGKGCPPELRAISLDTNTPKVIYSCDDGLNQYGYEQGQKEKIDSFTSTFSMLRPINLRKNIITVSIDVSGVETSPDSSYVMQTNFVANIFQDGVKKISIPFSGCNADQPLIVDGYGVTGIQDKILLLFSGKRDCFEGGYVGETVHLVSGLRIFDGSPIYESKNTSPLVPHTGSIVAYFKETPVDNFPTPEPVDQLQIPNEVKGYPLVILVISSAFTLLVGVLLGKWKRKESVASGLN